MAATSPDGSAILLPRWPPPSAAFFHDIATLHALSGEATVNQVAEYLHLSAAFITIETGKLKKLGIIDKKSHAEDKRKTCLSVTAEGDRLLDELLPVQPRINDVLFEGVSLTEFRLLCSVIDRLVVNGDRAALDLGHLQVRRCHG